MPNWCQNLLIVSGSVEDVEMFEFAMTGGYQDKILTFGAAVPMPESEKENWYNWSCENWGTKWDAHNVSIDRDDDQGWAKDDDDVHLSYRFDTAWSDPDVWFEQLAKQWPQVKLILNYCEAGCDFSGQHYKEKGATVSSHDESLTVGDLLASGFDARF